MPTELLYPEVSAWLALVGSVASIGSLCLTGWLAWKVTRLAQRLSAAIHIGDALANLKQHIDAMEAELDREEDAEVLRIRLLADRCAAAMSRVRNMDRTVASGAYSAARRLMPRDRSILRWPRSSAESSSLSITEAWWFLKEAKIFYDDARLHASQARVKRIVQ
jgi:hypothetical protein